MFLCLTGLHIKHCHILSVLYSFLSTG